MNDLLTLSPAQLNHAADLKEKIATLEKKLASIFGSVPAPTVVAGRRSKMSAAGRARIIAAQKARWAKVHAAGKVSPDDKKEPLKQQKGKMSAEGRARIAAAAKARWAKAKVAGKTAL